MGQCDAGRRPGNHDDEGQQQDESGIQRAETRGRFDWLEVLIVGSRPRLGQCEGKVSRLPSGTLCAKFTEILATTLIRMRGPRPSYTLANQPVAGVLFAPLSHWVRESVVRKARLFSELPPVHRKRMRATNMLERQNKESKRRTIPQRSIHPQAHHRDPHRTERRMGDRNETSRMEPGRSRPTRNFLQNNFCFIDAFGRDSTDSLVD